MASQSSVNKSIEVDTSTFVGSLYAKIVGFTVTDFDSTLEFVYLHPRNPSKGQVVSRVTLPTPVAKELGNLILSTIKQHEAKRQASK